MAGSEDNVSVVEPVIPGSLSIAKKLSVTALQIYFAWSKILLLKTFVPSVGWMHLAVMLEIYAAQILKENISCQFLRGI